MVGGKCALVDNATLADGTEQMLEIVGEALNRNRIQYVLCKNRSKDFDSMGPVEVFQSSPDIHVLLMPLAMGAEGLDLVVASHIFLLEPLLNAQQEMQAVNRIYRIGQTRRTLVHKYVMCDTVEERIVHFQSKVSCGEGRRLSGLKGLKTDDGALSIEEIQDIMFE